MSVWTPRRVPNRVAMRATLSPAARAMLEKEEWKLTDAQLHLLRAASEPARLVLVGPMGAGKATAMLLASCGRSRVVWMTESARVGEWAKGALGELSPETVVEVVRPGAPMLSGSEQTLLCAPDAHLWTEPDAAWPSIPSDVTVLATAEPDARARGWAEALAAPRCGYIDVSPLQTTRFRVIAPWRDTVSPDDGYDERLFAELARTSRQGFATRFLGPSREALGSWATRLMQLELGPERARLAEEGAPWASLGLEHDAPESVDPAEGGEREVIFFGLPSSVEQLVREALATGTVEKRACRAAIIARDARELLHAAIMCRHAQDGRLEPDAPRGTASVAHEASEWLERVREGLEAGQPRERLAYALVERLRLTRGQAHAVLALASTEGAGVTM